MKVRELIEILEDFGPEQEVHIAYNYGDYNKTIVAPAIKGIGECPVKHSAYHNRPILDEDGEENVVILSEQQFL